MLTVAVILIVVGVVIGVGSLAYDGVNFVQDLQTGDLTGMIRGHVITIIAMAIGGLAATIGFLLIVWLVVQHFLAS